MHKYIVNQYHILREERVLIVTGIDDLLPGIRGIEDYFFPKLSDG
jgi:hypothetical protein